MKLRVFASAVAGLLCCSSCIMTDSKLGDNLIIVDEVYDIYTSSCPITDIDLVPSGDLSGFSSTRVTVGAIREPEFGLTTRSSVITFIPLVDTLDFGTDPQFLRFHASMAFDSTSVSSEDQKYILQNLLVYELTEPLDYDKTAELDSDIPHGSNLVAVGSPMLNGRDSLSFDLDESVGKRFFDVTLEDLQDFDAYMKKVPGVYLTTSKPLSNGGRINMFELQLNYDSDYGYILGNYAKLSLRSKYPKSKKDPTLVQKDTTFMFYLCGNDFYDLDSLYTNSGYGSFPQYCLNLSSHESDSRQGKATDRILVEGGGGLKPRISAAALKAMAVQQIREKVTGSAKYPDMSEEEFQKFLKRVVINKASIILPFEYVEGMDYDKYPVTLSPTCRLVSEDDDKNEVTTYMGLTDASSANENKGEINYSLSRYAPDITYHMQEILKMDDDKIAEGNYDIWFLNMAYETVTTTTAGNEELSDYYKALAYSQYYGDMYGGYGGYGGYGYGYGYYGDPYSNYTSYMLAAQYAGQSTTSSSTKLQLDKDRFYDAVLVGPQSTSKRKPTFELTFSVPKPM